MLTRGGFDPRATTDVYVVKLFSVCETVASSATRQRSWDCWRALPCETVVHCPIQTSARFACLWNKNGDEPVSLTERCSAPGDRHNEETAAHFSMWRWLKISLFDPYRLRAALYAQSRPKMPREARAQRYSRFAS